MPKYAVMPQQSHAFAPTKNASDIELVIDAMELLHAGKCQNFLHCFIGWGLHQIGGEAEGERQDRVWVWCEDGSHRPPQGMQRVFLPGSTWTASAKCERDQKRCIADISCTLGSNSDSTESHQSLRRQQRLGDLGLAGQTGKNFRKRILIEKIWFAQSKSTVQKNRRV